MLKDLSGAKLGIFIFIGSTLLVLGIFLLGNKESLFRPTFTVKAYFKNIEGLRNGAPVRLGGIDVGSVKDIKIVQDTTGRVEVSMRLHNEIQRFIKKDTKASIETEGLVGNKVVVLQIGSASADPIGDGGIIQAKDPLGFGAVIDETQGIMSYTKEMTKNLAEIVAKINEGQGTIGKILTDEKLYNQATELTKRADQSLYAVIVELEKVSEIFKGLGSGVSTVISNVNKVVTEIDTVINGVSKGRGLLGQVLVEGSRYDSMFTSTMSEIQKTSFEARIAASRLSENMEALKHNWLFKSYFEERGYWDKAEYEDQINASINELNEKIKVIDQKIETLKLLEEKTSSNK
ncbi:MAG: MCE family protein [Ignavibacteriaceae bacterium]|nr:MCE family protein [Ignavibacteriaceae bacterium]